MRIRLLAAAAAILAASSAQAASFSFDTVLEGTGTIAGDSGTGTITAAWTATKFTAAIDFIVSNSFDFSFLSYSGSGSDQSGFTLDLLDGFGDAVTRYTTSSTACASSAAPVAGSCQLIGSTATSGRIAPDAGASLFGELAAGVYRLGFYESATPATGYASFGISEIESASQVPLPAAAPLLVAALAGLGFMRRRA